MAKWPDIALRNWAKSNSAQRLLVIWAIAERYGTEFAAIFKAEADLPRHKSFVEYYYGPGITWITPTKLRAWGYRLAQKDSVHEWWVHPKGDGVTRRWDRPERTPASDDAPSKDTGPDSVPETPPSPPQRKPPTEQTCVEAATLGDAICDNAGRICRIAEELGDDPGARASCERARQSCKDARTRVKGCGPPPTS